jgi:hypothetical protein
MTNNIRRLLQFLLLLGHLSVFNVQGMNLLGLDRRNFVEQVGDGEARRFEPVQVVVVLVTGTEESRRVVQELRLLQKQPHEICSVKERIEKDKAKKTRF